MEKGKRIVMENMRRSLGDIRELLGVGVAEIGELVGVGREGIEILESDETGISETEYVALCGVLDNFILNGKVAMDDIKETLKGEASEGEIALIDKLGESFITQWVDLVKEENIIKKIGRASKYLAETYKVFIDDTFLMEENSSVFLERFMPEFKTKENAIIVPLRVVEDLQEVEKGEDLEMSKRADKALKTVAKLQKEKVLEIRGESHDPNVYSTFISVFAKYKSNRHLFLLAQDEFLAEDLLEMNKKKAMKGFPIGAAYLDKDGGIELFEGNEDFVLEALAEEEGNVEDSAINETLGCEEFDNEPFGPDDEMTDEDVLLMEEIMAEEQRLNMLEQVGGEEALKAILKRREEAERREEFLMDENYDDGYMEDEYRIPCEEEGYSKEEFLEEENCDSDYIDKDYLKETYSQEKFFEEDEEDCVIEEDYEDEYVEEDVTDDESYDYENEFEDDEYEEIDRSTSTDSTESVESLEGWETL